MAKKKSNWGNMEPQKSSAAQFITYVASVGESHEKYELRYENENIWMSQKMLAAVYGVDLRTVSYHITKIFKDAELDKESVVQKYWITGPDGKNYSVNHYNLQVIIALGFKIDNEKAIAFRKWANQIVAEYTIKGWAMDAQRLKDGTPIADKYFEHLLEKIREIRLSERKFYQKVTDLYATAIDYDKTSNSMRPCRIVCIVPYMGIQPPRSFTREPMRAGRTWASQIGRMGRTGRSRSRMSSLQKTISQMRNSAFWSAWSTRFLNTLRRRRCERFR